MALSIATNLPSLRAANNLQKSQDILNVAMVRLSSGLRINSAADDVGGLALSEKLRAQIRGFTQANRNAQDGISLAQTADDGLQEVNNILARMKELATQSSNGTLTTSERSALQTEFSELRSEVDRISNAIEFNGTVLLNGGLSGGMTFHVGINNNAHDKITLSVGDSRAAQIGSASSTARLTSASVTTATTAAAALSIIDDAITDITDRRGTLGAIQNRLTFTVNTLTSTVENLTGAESRVRDADVATETAIFTRQQIISQAAVSVLSQANSLPSLALSLLT